MSTFAEIVTSRYATIFFAFAFIFAYAGIYMAQKRRSLNYFQRFGVVLLLIGMIIRILLLMVDYVHMLITNTHFIRKHSEGYPDIIKLEVFIKTPEVLFEFPLFAIGLDWLELAILLKSTGALSTDSYLRTHKRLQWIFFTVCVLVLSIIGFDIFTCLYAAVKA